MARVLVVDDDNDILRIVEKVLSSQGYEVFTASNAMIAMDLLNSTYFDALITDATMPHLSGFELLNSIRGNKKFYKMAIAMLTGRREKKDVEKAMKVGVDDYIVKPIDPIILLKKVEQLFAKKPPLETPAVKFDEKSVYSEAITAAKINVTSVTDSGATLSSHFAFEEQAYIEIHSVIFSRIGIEMPKLKVISSKRGDDDKYLTHIQFVGLSDDDVQKIRVWIFKQTSYAKDQAS